MSAFTYLPVFTQVSARMITRLFIILALSVGFGTSITSSWAADAKAAADSVSFVDAYIRLAPPSAPAAGAFMVIRNTGNKATAIVKADNPVSKFTELHTHLHEDGVMKMRPVKSIPVPAGGEAVLQPGGLHIMMIDLKSPLKEGDTVPLTFTFDDGSTKQVAVPIKKMRVK
jgi:copper(I)-binding protein